MQDTYTITMEALKKHMENEKARKDYPVIVIINGEYYDLLPDETTSHIAWCNQFIEQFKKEEGFDPYAALMDEETHTQKLYGLCLDYLNKIKETQETLNADFINARNKIVFNQEGKSK